MLIIYSIYLSLLRLMHVVDVSCWQNESLFPLAYLSFPPFCACVLICQPYLLPHYSLFYKLPWGLFIWSLIHCKIIHSHSNSNFLLWNIHLCDICIKLFASSEAFCYLFISMLLWYFFSTMTLLFIHVTMMIYSGFCRSWWNPTLKSPGSLVVQIAYRRKT